MRRTSIIGFVFALLILSSCVEAALAREIFVDNRAGNNLADGTSETANDPNEGPVRTIKRALVLAREGDVIVLKNNGVPYYEPIMLTGLDHSGPTTLPFTIRGNGAVISGLAILPPEAWFPRGKDLWKVTPAKKGYYQLTRGETVIPEFRIPEGTTELPPIPAGQWCAWKGAVYYQGTPDEDIYAQSFGLAREDMGISLYHVTNVRIENLTIRHFRIDGVNAHDGCRNVQLINVVSEENGRAGLVAAGTSDVAMFKGKLVGNRLHSLLVTERAAAEVIETELSTPATLDE